MMNGIYHNGNGPQISVAKHANGGYLVISMEVYSKATKVGGTATVFLDDGTVIKCIDNGSHDHVNNQSVKLYNLTTQEIENLKTSRISTIRFSLIGDLSGAEVFTADNERKTGPLFSDFMESEEGEEDISYNTEEEISALFD